MLGWPLLVHYCEDCHYNTTVEYSATVWKQEHTCSHCGHSSVGADISGRSTAEMNQSQHDELAALFSQQMNFSQAAVPVVIDEKAQDRKDSMQDTRPEAFISVSAHYTHTTHIRPPSEITSEPSRSPPPPYNESIMPEAMAHLLLQNSIDPAFLLPNQIQLFMNAEDEQRLRLLELWRISPPTYAQEKEHSSLAPTSMQQEELLAKFRFETKMAARALAAYQQEWSQQDMDFDTHLGLEPVSPNREAGDATALMRAASIAASRTLPKPGNEAEPYIVSGYQNVARTDPVYGAAPSLWQSPSYAPARTQQTMEDQYGNLMQIRNHADWEAMNERTASDRLAGFNNANSTDDDDMVM